MKTFKVLHIIMLGLFIGVFLNGIALATPMAEFSYVETDLGGGMWQYNYTLYNTSDPVADAGVDLYDVFFTFNPSAVILVSLCLRLGLDGGPFRFCGGYFPQFLVNLLSGQILHLVHL